MCSSLLTRIPCSMHSLWVPSPTLNMNLRRQEAKGTGMACGGLAKEQEVLGSGIQLIAGRTYNSIILTASVPERRACIPGLRGLARHKQRHLAPTIHGNLIGQVAHKVCHLFELNLPSPLKNPKRNAVGTISRKQKVLDQLKFEATVSLGYT